MIKVRSCQVLFLQGVTFKKIVLDFFWLFLYNSIQKLREARDSFVLDTVLYLIQFCTWYRCW